MLDRSQRSRPCTSLLSGLAVVAILAAGCTQGGGATPVPSVATSEATTQVMGTGTLHDVDGTAAGEAKLVIKPDGGYVVVLENFKIEAIAHTNVVLVSNSDVTATGDIDKSKLLDLGPLKATEGMQDFPIPAEMASTVMEGYHTVVIWDTEMAHAIAAAALK
ncbi:MAG: DM13 domain-containing protein [Chloroflexota bacterium]